MLMAGAISLGSMLGVLLAQRTSLRARNAISLVLALAAVCGSVALVAGATAAMTVAIVAPLGYAMRRILDGN